MSADHEVVQYAEFDVTAPSRLPHRVIPAVIGGVFAGLLLVGLGCTPLFKPEGSRAAPEQGTIVQGKAGAIKSASNPSLVLEANPTGVVTSDAPSAQSKPSSVSPSAGGTSTLATSSSRRGGAVAGDSDSHRFMIVCDGTHAPQTADAARPETVVLQGIMAGSRKAALLDGVLYREGDVFGSTVCPWTIAMIDARSVRIEKAFGDRTAGVTLHWQSDAAATSTATAPRPRAASLASAPRSR